MAVVLEGSTYADKQAYEAHQVLLAHLLGDEESIAEAAKS